MKFKQWNRLNSLYSYMKLFFISPKKLRPFHAEEDFQPRDTHCSLWNVTILETQKPSDSTFAP